MRKANHRWRKFPINISGGDAPGGDTRSHPEHVACACVSMLSPRRPMVLCWRRHGRAGGCRITICRSLRGSARKSESAGLTGWGYSSVGRAPALQAGGQGFEPLYLHGNAVENNILKVITYLNTVLKGQVCTLKTEY